MLKRILSLLLCAVLLVPAAQAEPAADPAAALYLLLDRNENGVDTPLGSALLLGDQTTLLTSIWAMQAQGDLYARGAGGDIAIVSGSLIALQPELLLLDLATPSPAAPLTLGDQGELSVLGHNAAGQPVAGQAQSVAVTTYNDADALVFTAPQPMLPCSFLIDEAGALAGLTLAEYDSGLARYVALGTAPILEALLAMGGESDPEDAGNTWIYGFTAEPGKGVIDVDWSACAISCDREDCVHALYFSSDANPYYSYYLFEEETSATVPAVPGSTMNLWLRHTHQDDADDSPYLASVVPTTVTLGITGGLFDLYDYHDEELYLGLLGEDPTAMAQNLGVVTPQALTDPDTVLYLQVRSTYAVEEEIHANLIVALTTPEAYSFTSPGGFIFDPALQDGDVWGVELDELFEDYIAFSDTGALAPGRYVVRYYLDDILGGEISWTLE